MAASNIFLKGDHTLTAFDRFPSIDSVSEARFIDSGIKLIDLDNFSSLSPQSSKLLLSGLL